MVINNFLVTFTWSGKASLVSIFGNFPNENFEVPHLLKVDDSCNGASQTSWSLGLNLPPGKFLFKFKVDGQWALSDSFSKDGDANVVVVA